MAVIQSGASADLWTIDPISKAGRVSLYSSTGDYLGRKRTYRAATTAVLVTAASAAPFCVIEGSASKTARIQRIHVSGPTLTAVAYNALQIGKYSTAASGGTSTNLAQVPLDSNDVAGSLNAIRVYTAAPTAGTLVGVIASRRALMQATTAAAAGVFDSTVWDFDFRNTGEAHGPTLRGVAEAIGLFWLAAPATAVSVNLEVEWTEE